MGGVTFTLAVRAELTEAEESSIRTYRLGNTTLYERMEMTDPGEGLLGAASRLAFRMRNLTLSVNDLLRGKTLDFRDIVEMLAAEDQIREAAQTFKNVLDAAASFGGETVLELS
jgi:hypothetical protein